MAAFFSFGLGIGWKEGKDEAVNKNIKKVKIKKKPRTDSDAGQVSIKTYKPLLNKQESGVDVSPYLLFKHI